MENEYKYCVAKHIGAGLRKIGDDFYVLHAQKPAREENNWMVAFRKVTNLLQKSVETIFRGVELAVQFNNSVIW